MVPTGLNTYVHYLSARQEGLVPKDKFLESSKLVVSLGRT